MRKTYTKPAFNQLAGTKKEIAQRRKRDEVTVRISQDLYQNRKLTTVKKGMKQGKKFYIR